MTNYLAKLKGLSNELTFIGASIIDDDLMIYMLNGHCPMFKEIIVGPSKCQPYRLIQHKLTRFFKGLNLGVTG